MNLEEKTIDELKVIGFDIDQQIKISQQNYQAVIQVLNKKLEEQSKVEISKPSKSDAKKS